MMHGFLTFCCIFKRYSPTSFTTLLASNLLAQFSRQIVIQILGLESPKVCRPWKDHFKSDLRSDQDHLLKKDLRSDQDHIFKKSDLDLKSRSKIMFCSKSPLFEGQIKTDQKSILNF
jgi:hypothetical protein